MPAEDQPRDESRPTENTLSSEEAAHDDQDERGTLWYLVWCHERSCKEESKELREILGRMAHDAGGRLFCVKKARAYGAWRTRAGRRAPHLLLTDWREIKPCMQAMASSEPSASELNRPLLVAVLAEEQKLFHRVQEWSRTLRAAGNDSTVEVIRTIDELLAVLAEASPALGRHSSWSEGPGKRREAALARSTPLVSSLVARGLPTSVVEFLFSMCGWHTAAAVEKVLRLAATDQVYED